MGSVGILDQKFKEPGTRDGRGRGGEEEEIREKGKTPK